MGSYNSFIITHIYIFPENVNKILNIFLHINN